MVSGFFLLPLDSSLQLAGLFSSLPLRRGDIAEILREKEWILGFAFPKLSLEMTPMAGGKMREAERERSVGRGAAGWTWETTWM